MDKSSPWQSIKPLVAEVELKYLSVNIDPNSPSPGVVCSIFKLARYFMDSDTMPHSDHTAHVAIAYYLGAVALLALHWGTAHAYGFGATCWCNLQQVQTTLAWARRTHRWMKDRVQERQMKESKGLSASW
eukprot:6469357-Amphidinium_carterae.1